MLMKTKRKIIGVLLVLCVALIFVPTTALAEENGQSSKTAITSVAELQQFAQDVNSGKYDNKTDAIVMLNADLDLSGVSWTPIGAADTNGNVEHCFSGKFYGNGHTISNLDFSSVYGSGVIGGFFGYIENAEISGLNIKGKIDINSTKDYTYFGTIAGYAEKSNFSDCVSDVSFTNNDKYVYGTLGMIGYAENTKISYCENKGNLNITGDLGSLYAGGIAGFLAQSEVSYCKNTGDMTLSAPHGGSIVGQTGENSKVTNCYATGKLTPIGKGISDIGGIAGTMSKGAIISHCYFAGDIGLSQYTATPPYGRFGGIVGKLDADSVTFKNNYFAEKENVTSGGKGVDAGTAKTLDYMKTEEFYKEIKGNGGDYIYNPGGTPVFPALKYSVSFAVIPKEASNVIIEVNGQKVVNGSMDLAAGTYTVKVTADNCEALTKEITISADTATHMQILALSTKQTDAVTPAGKTDQNKNDTSAQTGDSMNLGMWIALLLISGGAAAGTAVLSRKRKYSTK